MSTRYLITPEVTAQEIADLSTDTPATPPKEAHTSLHIRTSIRAGAAMDGQSLLGPSEGEPGSV
jgi:hypothetical protein